MTPAACVLIHHHIALNDDLLFLQAPKSDDIDVGDDDDEIVVISMNFNPGKRKSALRRRPRPRSLAVSC